ncbi:MAG: nuclear transport factor 2 family protein [Bacteroidota bacterium]
MRSSAPSALLFVLLVGLPLSSTAQPKALAPTDSGPLFDELARMDSLIFDASFVRCDYDEVVSYFAEDAEFYHDQTGMLDAAANRESFKRLTANCPGDQGLVRTLVPGSMRVYQMHGYGAIQTGTHTFSGPTPADGVTTALFTHLWRKDEAGWKLTRVLSYDHRFALAETLAEDDVDK